MARERIKVFKSDSIEKLEKLVNDWLEQLHGDVLSVRLADCGNVCLVYYIPAGYTGRLPRTGVTHQ